MADTKYFEYSAELDGEKHSVVVALDITNKDAKDKEWLEGELRLWIDNEQDLYELFYGLRPSEEVLNAEHENVKVKRVKL